MNQKVSDYINRRFFRSNRIRARRIQSNIDSLFNSKQQAFLIYVANLLKSGDLSNNYKSLDSIKTEGKTFIVLSRENFDMNIDIASALNFFEMHFEKEIPELSEIRSICMDLKQIYYRNINNTIITDYIKQTLESIK